MINCSCLDLINQAPGLALIKDINSRILASSPRMTTLLGFKSSDEMFGLTDFDLRCDAVNGANFFIQQDQEAFRNGGYRAIDIYQYADGKLKMLYHEKKAIIINNEVVGLSFSGHEMTKLHQASHYLYSLLKKDGGYLTLDQQKSTSYTFSDRYPDSDLTTKESLCLYYILRGKSNKEISEILHLSCRTVEGKVLAIKEKLDCTTRPQLIETALGK